MFACRQAQEGRKQWRAPRPCRPKKVHRRQPTQRGNAPPSFKVLRCRIYSSAAVTGYAKNSAEQATKCRASAGETQSPYTPASAVNATSNRWRQRPRTVVAVSHIYNSTATKTKQPNQPAPVVEKKRGRRVVVALRNAVRWQVVAAKRQPREASRTAYAAASTRQREKFCWEEKASGREHRRQ